MSYLQAEGGAKHWQTLEPQVDYLQRIRDLEQSLSTAKGIISQQQCDLEECRTGKEKTEVYLDGRINDLKEGLHKTYEQKKNLEIEFNELRKARDNIKIEIEYWRKDVQELERKAVYAKRLKSEEAKIEQDIIKLQSKAKEWEQHISKLKNIDDMETAYRDTVAKIEKIEELKMKKIEEYLKPPSELIRELGYTEEDFVPELTLDKKKLWERLWS